MSSVTVIVKKNDLGKRASETRAKVGAVVHKYVFVLEGENKTQIVAFDAVDSSNMLNTQKGHITGEMSGEVRSPAPYSAFSNYGTDTQAAKPWADTAAAIVKPKMDQEIADVMRGR